MTKRARIIVRGFVQGVGFRMYTQSEASRLGLHGYVRNLPDGAVEIVAEGPADAVERMIAWTKHGPPAAQVEDVDLEHTEPTGEFSDFSIRH
jgi:acylphosphatase